MLDPITDAKVYINHLDEFMQRLKNELDSLSRERLIPASGQTSPDEYLLELNSFYYESFHRRFFPSYKQIIEEEIRELHHIGTQEETLKKDLSMSFKQHARLFNQVKSISALLKSKRQEMEPLLTASLKGNDVRSVDLLFILKELANSWNSFLTVLRNVKFLMEDKKLLSALNEYPVHALISNFIYRWEPENSKALRELNRLMAGWQLAVQKLIKLQETQTSKESYGVVLYDLEEIDNSWDNRKVPATLRSWYKQYVQKTFHLYLDGMNLYKDKNDRRRSVQAAGQFENWLSSLLYIMEQSLLYKSRGWGDLISKADLLNGIDDDYLKELINYSARILQTLEELINSLSGSTQANYKNHSQRAGQILTENYQYLKLQRDNNICSRAILLEPELERLINQITLLESRLELLDDKEEFSVQVSQQYQLIVDSLDSSLDLLIAIREELEQTMAPRNIKRNFQNIDIKIDHIAIAEGALFPSDYYSLMEKMGIETQEAAVPEGQVLYEEGDIFIIHIDELEEAEIPKIIIAKKG